MAKNKTAAGTNRGKKSVAVRVFDIIFIVLAVLLVIAALIIFTPRNKILVKLPQEFTSSLYTWTKWHVLKPFSTRTVGQGAGLYIRPDFGAASRLCRMCHRNCRLSGTADASRTS